MDSMSTTVRRRLYKETREREIMDKEKAARDKKRTKVRREYEYNQEIKLINEGKL